MEDNSARKESKAPSSQRAMEWLKLTIADIEEAQSQARLLPPTPVAIKIDSGDLLPDTVRPLVPRVLRITDQDLEAVPPQIEASTEMMALERLMFQLINEARQAHLPGWLANARLKWHNGLAAVSRGHSADMLKRHYVEHDSPEGVSAANRIERFGIRFIACGENIGVVYGANSHNLQGIYDIHTAFMNQPKSLTNHRGNVLNPIWTHVGIGGAYKPEGALFMTQNFISAPGSRPHV
jgi:uncharacterized protein YkwD